MPEMLGIYFLFLVDLEFQGHQFKSTGNKSNFLTEKDLNARYQNILCVFSMIIEI